MFSLGIDVSKAKLDIALLDPMSGKIRHKCLPNTAASAQTLLHWLKQHEAAPAHVRVVMEPTGIYHEQIACALHEAGLAVSLVNPARARSYALSLGVRGKTDAADSVVLAQMGARQDLASWTPPPAPARELKALLARRAALAEDIQRESDRMEKALATRTPEAVVESLRRARAFLREQLTGLQHEIDRHIERHAELRRTHALLLSIDAVGPRVADEFTALLGCQTFGSAEQLASYLGLVPLRWESGSSVKGRPRLSKAGPPQLRKLLYMPAVVASRHNIHVKELYDRLIARGKPKMSAIAAAMRKLAHLCFGVVRSGRPYDANWLRTA